MSLPDASLIESMSPEARRELARLISLNRKVQATKALEKWAPWESQIPGMPGQAEVFRSTARTRLVMGGNRSGKTEVGAADTCHMFKGTHPYRQNVVPIKIKILATDFPNALRNTIIPKVEKFLPKSFITRREHNQQGVVSKLVGVNESVIDFMSYDQEVTKFESFDADLAWFDEPPPEVIYKAVRRGLIDREGAMLFTMTPLYEPWIYHTLWVPAEAGDLKDTQTFLLPTASNPYIKASEIEAIKEIYSAEEQEVRLYGQFKMLSGLIYKIFTKPTHVVPYRDWPRHWPVWMCLDPHIRKPHAVTWMGVTPEERKVILDELAFDGSIKELAPRILGMEARGGYRIVDRLVDTSINAIDREDNLRHLTDAGIRCRFPRKQDSVLPGIEDVRSALTPRPDPNVPGSAAYPSLVVRENCVKTIRQFMSYIWDEPTSTSRHDREAPVKKEDDYMDNVRYLISVKPRFDYRPVPIQYAHGFGTYGIS
jgi:phage terminase large subunit-like protein